MGTSAPRVWTVAEYLAHEAASPVRHEFYGGRLYAMSGASPRHGDIVQNLASLLGAKLSGTPCRGRIADMRVRIEATGFHTYPDYLILCGKGQYAPDDPHSLLNPSVLFEVLSPSTEKHDRTFKMDQYRRIPSLLRYVLIDQDAVCVEVYAPTDDGWRVEVYSDPSDLVELGLEGVGFRVAEVYHDLEEPLNQ